MGFEGKTNLHDTKAEHNHTNSPHQTENEIGQIVDYLNGVIGSFVVFLFSFFLKSFIG